MSRRKQANPRPVQAIVDGEDEEEEAENSSHGNKNQDDLDDDDENDDFDKLVIDESAAVNSTPQPKRASRIREKPKLMKGQGHRKTSSSPANKSGDKSSPGDRNLSGRKSTSRSPGSAEKRTSASISPSSSLRRSSPRGSPRGSPRVSPGGTVPLDLSTTSVTPKSEEKGSSKKEKVRRGKDKILPIQSEDGKDHYVCPICNAALPDKHVFTSHIRSHNAPISKACSVFTCLVCGKVLSSQSSLDRHGLVHSGERPFKCKYCDMAFTTNGNMNRHMKIHDKNAMESVEVKVRETVQDGNKESVNKHAKESPSKSISVTKAKKLPQKRHAKEENVKNTKPKIARKSPIKIKEMSEETPEVPAEKIRTTRSGRKQVPSKAMADYSMDISEAIAISERTGTTRSKTKASSKRKTGESGSTVLAFRKSRHSKVVPSGLTPMKQDFTKIIEPDTSSRDSMNSENSTPNATPRHRRLGVLRRREKATTDVETKPTSDTLKRRGSSEEKDGLSKKRRSSHEVMEPATRFGILEEGSIPLVSPSKRQLERLASALSESSKRKMSEGVPNQGTLLCPVCKKSFLSYYGMQTHLETHPNYAIRCQLCNLTFMNPRGLIMHRRMVHRNRNGFTEGQLNGFRPECIHVGFYDLSFTEFSSQKFPLVAKAWCEEYKRNPSSSFHDFTCTMCTKSFPCPSAYALHQKTHTVDTKSKCDICSTDVETHNALEIHKLKHVPQMEPANQETDQKTFLAGFELKSSALKSEPFKYIDDESYHRNREDFKLNSKYYDILDNTDVLLPYARRQLLPSSGRIPESEDSSNSNDFADVQDILKNFQGLPPIPAVPSSPIRASSTQIPIAMSVKTNKLIPTNQPSPSKQNIKTSNSKTSDKMTSDLSDTVSENSTDTVASTVKQMPNAGASDVGASRPESPTPSQTDIIAMPVLIEQCGFNPLKFPVSGVFPCGYCSMAFNSFESLKVHVRAHSAAPYKCKICNYSSIDKSTLLRHLRSHNGERPFICSICTFAFTTKANCERHVRNRHFIEDKKAIDAAISFNRQIADKAANSDAFHSPDTVCKYCGKDFKFFKDLNQHMRVSGCNRKPFLCQLCRSGFTNKANCIRHINSAHIELKGQDLGQYVVSQFIENDNQQCDRSSPSVDLETILANLPPPPPLTPMPGFVPTSKDDSAILGQTGLPSPPFLARQGNTLLPTSGLHIKQEICDDINKNEGCVENMDFNNSAGQGLNMMKISAQIEKAFQEIHRKSGLKCEDQTEDCGEECESNKSNAWVDMEVLPDPMKKLCKSGKAKKENKKFIHSKLSTLHCPGCELDFRYKFKFQVHLKMCRHPSCDADVCIRSLSPESVNLGPTSHDLKCVATKEIKKQRKRMKSPRQSFGSDCSGDLSSVSKMLAAANPDTFQTYLHSDENESDRNLDNTEPEPIDSDSIAEKFGGKMAEHNQQPLRDATVIPVQPKRQIKSSSSQKLTCPYCPRAFPWISSLRRHILTHTGQRPFKCPNCPDSFSTKTNMERHLLRKHKLGRFESKIVYDKPFKCPLCMYSSFSHAGNLLKHYKEKHPHKTPPSYVLGKHHTRTDKKMQKKDKLEQAVMITTEPDQTNHAIDVSLEPGTSSQSQPEMTGPTSEQDNDPTGIDNHNIDKITKCWLCGEELNNRKLLLRHLKEHDVDFPFKCYLCDASFETRKQCLEHTHMKHPLEWLSLCERNKVDTIENFTECLEKIFEHNFRDSDSDRRSPTPSCLDDPDSHLRKVYCSFCHKRFWSLQDLRRHMRSHSGEKPFQCDFCQRRFTLKHSMMRHRKIHIEAGMNIEDGDLGAGDASNDLSLDSVSHSGTEGSFCHENPQNVDQPLTQETAQHDDDGDGNNSNILHNLLGVEESALDEILDSVDNAAELLGVKK